MVSQRGGLFTPDMAFEITVKEQIKLLKNPSLKCVDLVVNEVSKIVGTLTDKISKYPRLKDEIQRAVSGYLREREQVCKENLSLFMDIQQSYINTYHEDFIGFTKYECLDVETILFALDSNPDVYPP